MNLLKEKNRYNLIDCIRGLTICSMIIYHLVWDLNFIFAQIEPSVYKLYAKYIYIWQQSICWSFIFLSGFCWSMGRYHFKRGAIVFSCGLAITLITAIFMPKNIVLFGILTFLGFAMLIMIPLQQILSKIPNIMGFWLSFSAFILVRNINKGFFGFASLNLYPLPEIWYANYFTAAIGLPSPRFYSADYFAIFPWIFLFITGYFAYQICKQKHWLRYLKNYKLAPFNLCGKHSLSLYLAHQPLLYTSLFVIDDVLDII